LEEHGAGERQSPETKEVNNQGSEYSEGNGGGEDEDQEMQLQTLQALAGEKLGPIYLWIREQGDLTDF
jgi:hypothetical protein